MVCFDGAGERRHNLGLFAGNKEVVVLARHEDAEKVVRERAHPDLFNTLRIVRRTREPGRGAGVRRRGRVPGCAHAGLLRTCTLRSMRRLSL